MDLEKPYSWFVKDLSAICRDDIADTYMPAHFACLYRIS